MKWPVSGFCYPTGDLPRWLSGKESPYNTVVHFMGQCYFINGTERVRYVTRYIYNQEETAYYDSEVGEYRGVTPIGRYSAKYWNSQKDILERTRAELDTVCRHNYQLEVITSLQHQGWTGWISLLSKGLSRVFSNTTVQKHRFFCAQLYL
ncbi:hypothetical protein FD754_023548 [Muntiacus muntjak]|uniref:MHC class II beta chain N-terminal domain-containing protein n=1 Tax=Muntiacus muntjak TaxID=9888 RepID=A0A5N3UT15_MUNMU|nr:hypothetical protein FD754_023548 [Muntiacus muntjak]